MRTTRTYSSCKRLSGPTAELHCSRWNSRPTSELPAPQQWLATVPVIGCSQLRATYDLALHLGKLLQPECRSSTNLWARPLVFVRPARVSCWQDTYSVLNSVLLGWGGSPTEDKELRASQLRHACIVPPKVGTVSSHQIIAQKKHACPVSRWLQLQCCLWACWANSETCAEGNGGRARKSRCWCSHTWSLFMETSSGAVSLPTFACCRDFKNLAGPSQAAKQSQI